MATGPKEPAAAELCNICMTEPTTPRPNGLRFSICYNSALSRLHLERFHNISDVHLLLRACAPIQQFCKVSHKDAGDASAFETLTTYMTRRRQVGLHRTHDVLVLTTYPVCLCSYLYG